jgi:hypothetical protein
MADLLIATKAFCNTLKAGSFTGDTTMCPTRSQIEAAGLYIKKGYTYATDQLVPQDHIERLDWEYTFSVTPTTTTISAAGGSQKFTVTSYKRQYSYSNAGNRIYVEGSQTNVGYTSSNSGSGTWTAANDTISYGANTGSTQPSGTITWTQSESFGSDPKKTATATHKQNADSIKPSGDGYSNPRITAFSYPTVIPAAGGNSTPSYSYEQTVYWVSGKTTTLTSGGTPTFNRTSGTATVNSSSGLANTGSKGTTQSGQTTVAVVSLTITMNGKSSSASSANVSQAENRIENTSWNSWNVSVSADKTNFPREGGTTTVRASASRSGTYTWSSGSTSSASDSGTPSLILSNTSGFSLSSSSGTSVTLTVSVNNGAERSTRVTASYGGASDWVEINQEVGILTKRETVTSEQYSISISPSSLSWSWNDTSSKSFSVSSQKRDGERHRDGTSNDGGNTWNWGNWVPSASSYNWGNWYNVTYSGPTLSGSSFSISGSTVKPTSNNTGSSSRTGTITVSNSGDSATLSLSQGINRDYDYRIRVSSNSYNFSSGGGSTTITVYPEERTGTGNPVVWGSWTASSTGSYDLSTSSLPSGISASKSGNTVTVTATANSSTSSGRSGSFTVTHYNTAYSGSRPSASVSITQDRKVSVETREVRKYFFSVSPSSLNFTSDGGSKSVTVTSYYQTATQTSTDNGPWLPASPTFSGKTGVTPSAGSSSNSAFSVGSVSGSSGTYTVNVTASSNSSTSNRSGSFDISQSRSGNYSDFTSDDSSLNVPLNQEGKEKEPISITVGFDISKTSDNWDLYSYILQWNGPEIKENIEFTIVNEYNPLYSYDFSIISSSSIEPPKTFLSYATTIPPFIITGDLLTGTVLTDKDYVTNYTLNINPLDTTGSNPDDDVYITIYYTGLTNMYFWFDNSNFPTISTHVFDYGSSSGKKFLIGNKEPYTVFTGTGNDIEFNKGDTSNVYLCRDIYNTSEKVYGPYTFRFSGNNTIDIR